MIRTIVISCLMLSSTSSLLAQPCDTCWLEHGDAGDLPATAQMPENRIRVDYLYGSLASPNDVDMYLLSVCVNEAHFMATSSGTGWDTRLYLFSLDGLAIVQRCSAQA